MDPAETNEDGEYPIWKLEVAPTIALLDVKEQPIAALVILIGAEFDPYVIEEEPGW